VAAPRVKHQRVVTFALARVEQLARRALAHGGSALGAGDVGPAGVVVEVGVLAVQTVAAAAGRAGAGCAAGQGGEPCQLSGDRLQVAELYVLVLVLVT
jgi:hypothetical protein